MERRATCLSLWRSSASGQKPCANCLTSSDPARSEKGRQTRLRDIDYLAAEQADCPDQRPMPDPALRSWWRGCSDCERLPASAARAMTPSVQTTWERAMSGTHKSSTTRRDLLQAAAAAGAASAL